MGRDPEALCPCSVQALCVPWPGRGDWRSRQIPLRVPPLLLQEGLGSARRAGRQGEQGELPVAGAGKAGRGGGSPEAVLRASDLAVQPGQLRLPFSRPPPAGRPPSPAGRPTPTRGLPRSPPQEEVGGGAKTGLSASWVQVLGWWSARPVFPFLGSLPGCWSTHELRVWPPPSPPSLLWGEGQNRTLWRHRRPWLLPPCGFGCWVSVLAGKSERQSLRHRPNLGPRKGFCLCLGLTPGLPRAAGLVPSCFRHSGHHFPQNYSLSHMGDTYPAGAQVPEAYLLKGGRVVWGRGG